VPTAGTIRRASFQLISSAPVRRSTCCRRHRRDSCISVRTCTAIDAPADQWWHRSSPQSVRLVQEVVREACRFYAEQFGVDVCAATIQYLRCWPGGTFLIPSILRQLQPSGYPRQGSRA
jgi:hypothetical protein